MKRQPIGSESKLAKGRQAALAVRREGRRPFIRRRWLEWTTVHCADHGGFLSVKNRSIGANVPHVKWQEVWASKPTWREALQLQKRGVFAGSIWYKVPTQLSRCTPRLIRLLERLANPTDVPANKALGQVLET